MNQCNVGVIHQWAILRAQDFVVANGAANYIKQQVIIYKLKKSIFPHLIESKVLREAAWAIEL